MSDISCPKCSRSIPAASSRCRYCGHILNKAKQERKQGLAFEVRLKKVEEHNRKIVRQGRNTLYFLGGGIGLLNVLMLLAFPFVPDMLLTFGLAVAFIALGWLCNRKPMPALIAGLVLYLSVFTINVISFSNDEVTFNFLPIVVIALLVRAILKARNIKPLPEPNPELEGVLDGEV